MKVIVHRAQAVSFKIKFPCPTRQIVAQLEALFDGYVEIHNSFEVMIDEKSMNISITLAHGEIETT
jgi:hypothetical protein